MWHTVDIIVIFIVVTLLKLQQKADCIIFNTNMPRNIKNMTFFKVLS